MLTPFKLASVGTFPRTIWGGCCMSCPYQSPPGQWSKDKLQAELLFVTAKAKARGGT